MVAFDIENQGFAGKADRLLDLPQHPGRPAGTMGLEKPADCGAWLEEAVTLARKADMRRLQADALTVYSQQQAALKNDEQAGGLWRDAQKLFAILRAPQANMKPAWLNIDVKN